MEVNAIHLKGMNGICQKYYLLTMRFEAWMTYKNIAHAFASSYANEEV